MTSQDGTRQGDNDNSRTSQDSSAFQRYRRAGFGAAAVAFPEAAPAIMAAGAADQARQLAREAKQREKNLKLEADRLKQLRRNERDSGKKGGGFQGILIIAIAAHLVICLFKNVPWYLITLTYLVIVVIGFFSNDNRFDSDWFGLAGASVAAAGIPYIFFASQDKIPYQWLNVLYAIVMLFPFLVLYIAFKADKDSWTFKLARFWIVLWIILGMIFLLTSPLGQGLMNDKTTGIGNPLQVLTYVWNGVIKALTTFASSIGKTFDMWIAIGTNQQYSATPEDERGIYLDNAKPVETIYYPDSRVYVEANIRAKNIPKTVVVKTSCFVENSKIYGTTSPKQLSLINNDENIIDCDIGNLSQGAYTVKVVATFEYESDAKIQYYFVDSQTSSNMYSKLNIPEKSVATYTGGPVEVGLPSLHQPLRVSSDPTQDVGNYPFGVSLVNNWDGTGGKILRGLEYDLETPSSVTLVNCNRMLTGQPVLNLDGRNHYTFMIDQQNLKETFDSVGCRMNISSSIMAGAQLYTIKTFNAKTVFEYSIEAPASVTVQNSYAESQ